MMTPHNLSRDGYDVLISDPGIDGELCMHVIKSNGAAGVSGLCRVEDVGEETVAALIDGLNKGVPPNGCSIWEKRFAK